MSTNNEIGLVIREFNQNTSVKKTTSNNSSQLAFHTSSALN